MQQIAKPKLTNRGPAGLLSRPATPAAEIVQPDIPVAVDKIAEALEHLVVPISQLISDPNNARLHPDRNLKAVEQSLRLYGQVKPVVVQKSSGIVVAGNGTLEVAKSLGWTKLAAAYVELTDVEALGYGLADNRSAELAKWDFEIIARTDRLLQAASHPEVGWSADELEVLRSAEWTPPPIDDSAPTSSEDENALIVEFTEEQMSTVMEAVQFVRDAVTFGAEGDLVEGEMSEAECLTMICRQWMETSDAFSEGISDAESL